MMSHDKVFLIYGYGYHNGTVNPYFIGMESIAGFPHPNDHQMYIISIGLVMDPTVIEMIIGHFDDVIRRYFLSKSYSRCGM